MTFLAITRKILLEYLREPLLLGLIFAFPVILLLFYAIAFGETDQGMAKHLKIMVLNQDAGYQPGDGERLALGEELIRSLKDEKFEGIPVFDIQEVETQSQAEITLRDQKAALLLVIPTDFSRVLLTADSGEWTGKTANLSLVGYPSSNLYAFTRSYLEGIIAAYTDKVAGWNDEILAIEYAFVPGTGTMSDFEFGVPGSDRLRHHVNLDNHCHDDGARGGQRDLETNPVERSVRREFISGCQRRPNADQYCSGALHLWLCPIIGLSGEWFHPSGNPCRCTAEPVRSRGWAADSLFCPQRRGGR